MCVCIVFGTHLIFRGGLVEVVLHFHNFLFTSLLEFSKSCSFLFRERFLLRTRERSVRVGGRRGRSHVAFIFVLGIRIKILSAFVFFLFFFFFFIEIYIHFFFLLLLHRHLFLFLGHFRSCSLFSSLHTHTHTHTTTTAPASSVSICATQKSKQFARWKARREVRKITRPRSSFKGEKVISHSRAAKNVLRNLKSHDLFGAERETE